MSDSFSRRDWLRMIGASGVAVGLGAGRATNATAQESGFQSSVIAEHETQANRASPSLIGNKVIQPRRELPLLHKTDVLVVGGGPAGICAAIAARRAGADVTIVERYGHFGGLWTGGLVLLVIGHIIMGERNGPTVEDWNRDRHASDHPGADLCLGPDPTVRRRL